jgi:hypothetical protein
MIEIIEGYKASFHNLAYIFLILFLMQYFYNIVELRYNLQIMAEKAAKQAPVEVKVVVPTPKVEPKKEEIKESKKVEPKKNSYAAGAIIDFSLYNETVAG